MLGRWCRFAGKLPSLPNPFHIKLTKSREHHYLAGQKPSGPLSNEASRFTPKKKVQMFKITSKALVATALSAALVLGGTAVSFAADATPAPTSNATKAPKVNPNKEAMDAFRAAQGVFKIAQDKFKAEKGTFDAALAAYKTVFSTYAAAKKVVADTFKASVQAANAAHATANAAATTDAQKADARAARKAAIAAATTVRDAAIATLGAVPVRPVAPVRPTPPAKPVHIEPTHAPKVAPSATPAP
jgi:hypothetical protein